MIEGVPLRIHSHPRSGTHLLAASIYQNFEFSDLVSSPTIRPGMKFVIGDKTWMPGQKLKILWGKFLTNHNFYNPTWSKNPEKILYIVRHPIQSMISYWRITDPQCQNDPEEHIGEGRMRFWQKHVDGYTQNCHWVRYEDLVGEQYDKTLDKIQHWFNLTPKNDTWGRVKDRVGWYSIEEPIQDKQPTPKITKKFKEFFPKGYLGYDMDVLGEYDETTGIG